MILHKDVEIPGTHGPIVFRPPALQVTRTSFFAVQGEAEVVGQTTGRDLLISIILHDNYANYALLRDEIDRLDSLIGSHGKLTETGNVSQSFLYCTFMGFTPTVLGGQPEPGPLLDAGACLDSGWFIHGELLFHQITTGD